MQHRNAVGILCVSLVVAYGGGVGAEEDAQSATQQIEQGRDATVTLLLDFSQSFAPLVGEKETAVRTVMQALENALTQKWTSGTIYVAAIGSSSLNQQPPCGPAITFRPSLIASALSAAKGEIRERGVLQQWFIECLRLIRKQSGAPQQFTDISAAVAVSSDAARLSRNAKFLAIVSDFVEDLPKGNEAAPFKLTGERVLMLWSPETRDQQNPNGLFNRLDRWEQRLKSAGASAVVRLPIAGLTASGVDAWIR
jgi:hypothetical protein